MSLRRLSLTLLAGAISCGRPDAGGSPSGSTTSAANPPAAAGVSGEWPAELGPLLVIPADTENFGVVFYPIARAGARTTASRIALLSASGDTVHRQVTASGSDSARCGDAPLVRLSQATPEVWSIGVAGAARPLATDSLEGMTSEDSASYLKEMARLGSVAAAGVKSRLTGLRFALSGVRRLRLGDTTIVAARLIRRINQEANPVEERTIVIAEQSGAAPFTMVHSDRSEGTEESAVHFDMIGAFRNGGVLYLILSSDSPSGSTIEILRRAAGEWSLVWTRSISC